MLGVPASQRVQLLLSQVLDQGIGKIQTRLLEIGKELPQNLQQADALEVSHPMPIDDGGLKDPLAQIRWALLFCSLERDATAVRLVLAHQYELNTKIFECKR